ncbi:MAG: glycosyltransferase family 2 protein [Endomicrobia bacterium]|nr:glycosyltransferase family 2 protein [Endomicrobiia bacterium]MCX7941189.1 glycosyltransferase family 2 protein [Endomicrobiia bacterium]MDW8056221.1 glycosyltransferase family 2 protein [Elusimicrobiota bacterium]
MVREKLSVYIITYNEEKKIRDCLESIKWADEIVVVDSYSTDATVEICREYTDKIFYAKFEGFGKLRNLAVSYTSYDWVLSLDADERVSEELKDEILSKLTTGPDADAYFIPRRSHFLGYWIRYSGWYPDYRQPQFFNKKKMKYEDEHLVHEGFKLNPGAKISFLKGHIIQFPFLTLDEFIKKMEKYSNLKAQQMFNERKKFTLIQLVIHPFICFIRMYIVKLGFLDGEVGFILALLYSYYTFIKYVRLWELYQFSVKQ